MALPFRAAPLAGACLVALMWARSAHAGNGSKARTPPIWVDDEACVIRVDRSIDPVAHFAYAVADDDLVPPEVTDEVPDSRTHQFFAMCRQAELGQPPPNWISAADVAAAEMFDLVQDGDGGPETILQSNVDWAECFTRATDDDARVPITMAQAAGGLDWDTSAATPGNYVLYGYTWEPWINLWTGRPGIVQVHDGSDEGFAPAAALTSIREEQIIYRNTELEIEGCATGMPGSTWRVDVRAVPEGQAGEWVPYLPPASLEGEAINFSFVPPESTWGQNVVYLRIVVTDPMGREFAGITWAAMNINEGDDPDQCDEGGGFVVPPGCTGSESSESSGTSASETQATSEGPSSTEADAGPGGQEAGGSPSCACDLGGRPPRGGWIALLIGAGFARKRRRRAAA